MKKAGWAYLVALGALFILKTETASSPDLSKKVLLV